MAENEELVDYDEEEVRPFIDRHMRGNTTRPMKLVTKDMGHES